MAIQTVVRNIIQRWKGERDTLILGIQTDVNETIKAKEDPHDRIDAGRELVFFGSRGTYRGQKQFQSYMYCSPSNVDAIKAVMQITDGRKFPRDIAKTAVKEWGPNAAEFIRRNPFMLLRFPRCGFKICDALYLHLGLPPGALKRQLLCGHYALTTNTDGSIWHRRRVFDDAIRLSIQGADPQCDRAFALGMRAGILARELTNGSGEFDWDGDTEWISTSTERDREDYIARAVNQALSEQCGWDYRILKTTDHQKEELAKATQSNIGTLCGGGGVGKTWVIARLIKSLIARKIPPRKIVLVAPTGRAAVRLTEELRGHGVKRVTCRTYHSTLGWSPSGFRHGEGEPLDAEVIISDETSMVDQYLMYSLLRARPRGCPLLLVGDPWQLPPVGPGAPFRDVQAVVPGGVLTETHRNAGTIAATASAVRRGESWESDSEFDLDADPPRNHVHVECATPAEQLGVMEDYLERFAAIDNVDPVWDIQVVGLINRKSELSVHSINLQLQRRFNAADPIRGCIFRDGDKVICGANGWMLAAKSYCEANGLQTHSKDATTNQTGQIYVANGEFGKVLEVVTKFDRASYMVVSMTDPQRLIMVPLENVDERSEEGQTGSTFQLGYAITTHKSQGSQFRFVIAMVDGSAGAKWLADRSLWYTMLTRTKTACVSVGRKSDILSASKVSAIDQRKTFLVERMRSD